MGDNRIPLQNTFTHSDETHEFKIQWTQIGNPSKPPVVFIHGTPWSCVVWLDLAFALKDDYCIYLYDHPGFEQSPQPKRLDGKESELDESLSLRARASAALFQHWNLAQPPRIVAHDNGGLVSLRLFLEHGIPFTSLCLIDVVAIGPFGSPFFNLVANNHNVFVGIPGHFMEGFVRSYVRSATFKPLTSQVETLLASQWLEGGVQGPSRFLQEMIQAHNRTIGEIEKQYSNVGKKIPVKIIWGADDTWLPSDRAHRLAKALNASKVVLVDRASHLIHYDQPSKLAYEVGLWLYEHSQ